MPPKPDLLLLNALLVASFCLSACSGRNETPAATAPNQAAVVPVVPVSRGNLASSLVLTGEFIPFQEVDVMAKEAGYIKAIHVDLGDRVEAGARLAELEIPEMRNDMERAAAAVEVAEGDIETARGNVARAESAHQIAELSYQRILDVAKKEPGLVPRQEVDVAHAREVETAAQLSAAQADVRTAQHKIAVAKAEQGRWATLHHYTLITAPFGGIVTKRYANTGAMIQQGTASSTQAMPVVRLSQNNLLRLIVPVPESAAGWVRVGESVDVAVAALNRTFPGRVQRLEGKLALNTRTMNTEIDVPNRDYTLIPGMYAQVTLHTTQTRQVLAVPVEAIEDVNGAPHVYVVRDSTIHVVPVTVGIKTAEQEEIRSGLAENELVVVGRHAGLENGQTVRARKIELNAATPAGS